MIPAVPCSAVWPLQTRDSHFDFTHETICLLRLVRPYSASYTLFTCSFRCVSNRTNGNDNLYRCQDFLSPSPHLASTFRPYLVDPGSTPLQGTLKVFLAPSFELPDSVYLSYPRPTASMSRDRQSGQTVGHRLTSH